MTSTTDFWTSIADRVQPGWREGILASAPTKTELETQTVRMYLFDSLSMWVAGAALTREEFLQTRREAVTSVEDAQRLVDEIGRYIVAHGQQAIDPTSKTAYLALTCIMVALSRAREFDDSPTSNTVVEGDWYIVLYHLHNGKTAGRITFIAGSTPGLPLGNDIYMNVAALVFEATSPDSAFSLELKAGGGPVLNPLFIPSKSSLKHGTTAGRASNAKKGSGRGKSKR